MDKLPNCRVCLAGNVRMYLILNKNLHELYKKLTDIQFVTLDRRPMLACYLCCTRLKQCYQLQKQCREAEELFAQMMNEDIMPKPLTNPDGLEFYNGFVRTPVEHINISDESQVGYGAIKEELPETLDHIAELTEEPKSDEDLDYSCLHEDEISAHHPEPYSEDDVLLMEIKTEVEEEAEVSEKNQLKFFDSAAVAINRKAHRGRRKLEDDIIKEENNTEQSNTKIDPKIDEFPPGTGLNIKKPSSYANPEVNNITLATIRNGANNEDKSSKSTKSIDSHDVNKHRVQYVKRDDLDKLRVQGDNKREKQFICDTCFRVFSHRNTLLIHIRTHTGEKPFKCDICDRGFSVKANLITHFRIHTGEKPYKCTVCQSTFNKKTNLIRHGHIHTGKKPYKCTICQSSFSRKLLLEQHIRIHSGEKPYKCTICQSSFNDKNNLIRHGHIHTGKKPYKCTICQSSFSRKLVLEQHIRIHSGEKPYKCTLCQSSFSRKHHLEQHIRIHSGEKPYKCTICQSSFSRKHYLDQHMLIHSGEKPYKCTICQSSFNQKSKLIRHGHIHTGKTTLQVHNMSE